MALKQEYEYKFKAKIAEQRDKIDQKIKSETTSVFAELSAFFDSLQKYTLEADITEHEANKTFYSGFIGKQYAMIAIQFSQLLDKVQASQQAKISEIMGKKSEIESKISDLKQKITDREHKLTELEGKISSIESQASSNPNISAIQMAEIKTIQGELEKTHSETIDSIVEQKNVSDDLKQVAVSVVKEKAEKLAETAKDAKNEETTSKKEVVDDEAKQLVFEFMKESEETIKKSSESANIDENKLNEEKEVKTEEQKAAENKVPEQLELPFADPVEDKTVNNPDGLPATEEKPENQKAVKDAEETSKTMEETKKVLDINDTEMEQAAANPPAATPPANPAPANVDPADKNENLKKEAKEAKETVTKVKEVTDGISENVDKKIEEMQTSVTESHTLLSESKEATDKSESSKATNPLDTQQEVIKTTGTLKSVCEKQKETLESQKETVTALEESAKKLIDEMVIGTESSNTQQTEQAEKKPILSLDTLAELLREAQELLEKVMEDLQKAFQRGEATQNISDDGIMQASLDKKVSDSQNDMFKKLKMQTLNSEEQLKKVNNEVFFISGKLNSVDGILEDVKKVASETNKIIVDKNLPDVYKTLSSVIGEDKVILDRRGDSDDRRARDRRDEGKYSQELRDNNEKTIQDKEAAVKTSTTTDTGDRRDTSDRRASDDRRQSSPALISDMEKLELLMEARDNKLA
jgi:hypothetical protein